MYSQHICTLLTEYYAYDDMANSDTMNKVRHQQKWVMIIVYINIALYALCYQLQRPIEPFLVHRLVEAAAAVKSESNIIDNLEVVQSDDELMVSYGRLQSFFSLLQSIGSPIIGALLDRYGARSCFILVFISSALSYGILANSNSMEMLYLSKVPAVFQAAFLVAQAIVATAMPSESGSSSRAAALGRLTTAYTIGATIGPTVGGLIGSSGDYYLGAKLAVIGSLISAMLAFALPDNEQMKMNAESSRQTKTTEHLATFGQQNERNNISTNYAMSLFRPIWDVVSKRTVWPLLAIKVVSSVSNSMISTTLPLVLKSRGFDEAALGYNMSITSFAVAVLGMCVMGPITGKFGAFYLTYSSLFLKGCLAVTLAAVAASEQLQSTQSLNWFFIASVSLALSCTSHILATSLTTRTTGAVGNREQGILLGIEHSLFSGARIFGPSIGTFLMSRGGFPAVAALSFVIDSILGCVAKYRTDMARVKKSSLLERKEI